MTYTSKDPTEVVKKVSEEYSVPIHVYYCPGENTKRVNEVIELVSKEVGEVDVVIANAGELSNEEWIELTTGVSLWRDCIDMSDGESSKWRVPAE